MDVCVWVGVDVDVALFFSSLSFSLSLVYMCELGLRIRYWCWVLCKYNLVQLGYYLYIPSVLICVNIRSSEIYFLIVVWIN